MSRSGTVSVNGQRLSITQDARACSYQLGAASASFGAGGGSGHIDVTSIAGCTWRATTNASWIQVAGDSHSGSGTIAFTVAANGGGAREGVISVAGGNFVVSQADAPAPAAPPAPGAPATPSCTPVVSPLTLDTAAAPSTQNVQVTIGGTCSWTATSGVPWITVPAGSGGFGTGSVNLSIAQNTAGARTGTVTVAGQAVTVRQTALSCTFSISPSSQSLPAAGGSGQFTVTTQNACAWTASKNGAWIALTASSGTGTGTVTFTADANTTTAVRTGTITVGGQTFTISEAAAPCSYSLAPTSMNATADGGHGHFTVTTSSNCSWTATAGAPWVELANTSGTGSGDVNFNVQSNSTTTGRSTTITAGGQTFTVTQAAVACTYAISPASLSVAAGGGEGRFTLTTQAGCAWTASAAAAWVTVSTPSGTGSGDVVYTVQANSDPAARSTTVTAGGQTHTVNQAGAPAPCTYSISPSSQAFDATGGSSTFHVTTQSGCSWTAATAAPWIAVTSASGSGAGDVTYTVQSNGTGAPRSGTITLADQTYSVSQGQ